MGLSWDIELNALVQSSESDRPLTEKQYPAASPANKSFSFKRGQRNRVEKPLASSLSLYEN